MHPGTAITATRLTGWLLAAGVPANRITQTVGLRIPGKAGEVGGRIPDLVVWSKTQADGVWLPVADVLLVVEIISPGSEAADTVAKPTGYAGAGIPQYWTRQPGPSPDRHHVPTRRGPLPGAGDNAPCLGAQHHRSRARSLTARILCSPRCDPPAPPRAHSIGTWPHELIGLVSGLLKVAGLWPP